MEVRFSKASLRSLRRSNKARLIRSKIEELAERWPDVGANVTRLVGREEWRLRVQDWRVIFRVEADIVWIEDIGPRGAIYEG